MAQVVATRSIHGSFLSQGTGSVQERAVKLKPASFGSKVLALDEKKNKRVMLGKNSRITAKRAVRAEPEIIPVSPEDVPELGAKKALRFNYINVVILWSVVKLHEREEQYEQLRGIQQVGDTSVAMWSKPVVRRKTKIVCTIGPSTNTREMIWKLAETGMNVARLNMSHGDHASHQKGPEVRSGDLPQPITLTTGQEFTFTIRRGVGTPDCVSVNYDDFVNDVEVGDMLLVDGGMMSLVVKSKTEDSVKCEVVDGDFPLSSSSLSYSPFTQLRDCEEQWINYFHWSTAEKDWDDIKFGVDNKVDFYAVSFVKDAQVVHELKNYLQSCDADIHVIVKIESADSIPNLHSIITASDGAMVARGDLGAELPIEEVPLLQEEIIRTCRSMGKAVIVATNMLESMIVHPTPTRAEVSDIAIAVREGADAVMLSGETAHGKFPLKAVKVMHTVALRTEATISGGEMPPNLGQAFKNHMSEMFAYHATMMSNTLGISTVVFTRTGFMAILLSHYRPSGTIFAFTNEKRIQQRLALYQGVCPIYMEFSDDAEETFKNALELLQKQGMVKKGEEVALVQSGRQPIWRFQSTHNIQVCKV
ncbi:hypothetical protein Golax_006633 [Gossypium laxum]|uniref:Pyruvate kinase n=7 Tax=Gossypium TaxID=3633 RepID=A0A7J9A4E3_9ROSI|nr:hypothetical protein [Gossypium laxum]